MARLLEIERYSSEAISKLKLENQRLTAEIIGLGKTSLIEQETTVHSMRSVLYWLCLVLMLMAALTSLVVVVTVEQGVSESTQGDNELSISCVAGDMPTENGAVANTVDAECHLQDGEEADRQRTEGGVGESQPDDRAACGKVADTELAFGKDMDRRVESLSGDPLTEANAVEAESQLSEGEEADRQWTEGAVGESQSDDRAACGGVADTEPEFGKDMDRRVESLSGDPLTVTENGTNVNTVEAESQLPDDEKTDRQRTESSVGESQADDRAASGGVADTLLAFGNVTSSRRCDSTTDSDFEFVEWPG